MKPTDRPRGAGGWLAALAMVALLGWWTHGFRAFTTDGAALAAAGPMPRSAPPLAFVSSTGEPGSLQEMRGRYVLLTFMYLHCPDVCHLVTARLQRAQQQLDGLTPERLVFLSLSLDPTRDDTGMLHEHWRLLGGRPGWTIGQLSGTPGEVDDELAALGAWVTRLPDGRINHAASSYLVDPEGRVVAIFRPEVTADELVAALRARLQ